MTTEKHAYTPARHNSASTKVSTETSRNHLIKGHRAYGGLNRDYRKSWVDYICRRIRTKTRQPCTGMASHWGRLQAHVPFSSSWAAKMLSEWRCATLGLMPSGGPTRIMRGLHVSLADVATPLESRRDSTSSTPEMHEHTGSKIRMHTHVRTLRMPLLP